MVERRDTYLVLVPLDIDWIVVAFKCKSYSTEKAGKGESASAISTNCLLQGIA
jgi:hypothetical protein